MSKRAPMPTDISYLHKWQDTPTVDGLPWRYRKQALVDMREPVGRTLGVRVNHLPFGLPVYQALGMAPSQLPGHPNEKLLRTRGCDLALTLIGSHAPADSDRTKDYDHD